ncbi:SDR family NAD(P)-dependent oxidoreductase [Sphingopyxis sp. BSNA05]|uniref:SDR family NAD(P)-dependent oxidoreductase n=1 Tax=Sphingopyxis sp. BSNA05 TaxID=1236614 RepID=UPI0020B67A00|nr:SDR family NAD(P)-dependent oxidoreductase [Sphingopyxis sp. BSNA05]
MNLDLNDKTALVTASTGGIGLEIARSLAAEGATVIVNGRTQASVDTAIQSIRQDVSDAKLNELVADNGTPDGCQTTITKFAEVDILINNLGIYEAVGFLTRPTSPGNGCST